MDDDKAALPPYSPPGNPAPAPAPPPALAARRRRWGILHRRSRALKAAGLACLVFVVLAQWQQLWHVERTSPRLSAAQLEADLHTCKKLRSRPTDPVGPGRHANARYVAGGKPTLISNATIWTGEPAPGTSADDARAGRGWAWVRGDVLLERGLITRVALGGDALSPGSSQVPDDAVVYDAQGRPLTAGIIDMHSHAGVMPLPTLFGYNDGNEASDNLTPWARSKDGLLPLDPQIQVIKSGGVTTSLVLPGSANNIGGEAFLVKHAVGPEDGRPEISAEDMMADPDHTWRYMKMACGENAKRVHGTRTTRPVTRMGESYEFRRAFDAARDLVRRQDDWCDKAEALGPAAMDQYLPQDLAWETLGAALRGQVHINTHCYTVPDLEAMVDHTNEFSFPIRAFHHAHQTYLVPEILKRTWGGRPPSSAIFADNMYYKTEAYIGSPSAGKHLYDAGLTPIYVSDNPVLSAQHVLFEAAKGYHYGLPYHAALASVTTAPADDLGMGERIGKIKPGFDADVVVWDSDPLSVGAAPAQVWIDGTAQFEDPVVLSKPLPTGLTTVAEEPQTPFVEDPILVPDVVFTGITKILLDGYDGPSTDSAAVPINVAISGGGISCVGECLQEMEAAAQGGVEVVHLRNGHLHSAYVGVGGTLGLNEIDAETVADNGNNRHTFSRAIDGLLLEGKKLTAAHNAGVTRAISAPKLAGPNTHHGTSVGIVTHAAHSLASGAVFSEDAALHYTYDQTIRGEESYSVAFGSLREKLLGAARETGAAAEDPLPYSERSYLSKTLASNMTLALTINSADGIAAALRVKADVEKVHPGTSIRLAIVGGAEAYLVAEELAAADVGVILSPLQNMGESWDARRSLPGAPLSNGTAIDRLLDAGVKVAIGLREDWEVRDLAWAAGTAYRNGEGRLSEAAALRLVSQNTLEILGVETSEAAASSHFVVSEGSPLEIGSRVRAVGSGSSTVSLFV